MGDEFLVFWRHSVPSPQEVGEPHLARVQPEGTGLTQLSRGWPPDVRPDSGWLAISPDGQSVAYSDWADQTLRVKSLSDDQPGVSLGVKGDMWHWSPDGRELLVVGEDDAGREWRHDIVEIATKAVRPVRLPAVDRGLEAGHRAGHFVTDWSRDGQWYLTTFISPADASEGGIVLVRADGSLTKAIPGTERGCFGRFSPSGSQVLFKRIPRERESAISPPSHLFRVAVDGGGEQAVDAHAERQVMEYTWSPDGQQIAYTYREVAGPNASGDPTMSYLVIAAVDRTHARTLVSERGYSAGIRTLTAVSWHGRPAADERP